MACGFEFDGLCLCLQGASVGSQKSCKVGAREIK